MSKNKLKLMAIPLIIWILSMPTHAEKVKIKGMDIRYSEDQQEMTASGNAELIHPDFKFMRTIFDTIKKAPLLEPTILKW